jgi:hypothetical protein
MQCDFLEGSTIHNHRYESLQYNTVAPLCFIDSKWKIVMKMSVNLCVNVGRKFF